MMREIKFRARALKGVGTDNDFIEAGDWVEGYYYFSTEKVRGIIVTQMTKECGGVGSGLVQIHVEIDLKTLSQFTGYLDKKGQEVYEGDFVQFSYEEGSCGIVSNMSDGSPNRKYIAWDKDEGCWAWYQLDGKKQTAGMCCYKSVCARHVEVTSSIHQHPELLETS